MNKENTAFYKCETCGNIIGLIEGNISNIKCCEHQMKLLIHNIEEAVTEKHIPIYEIVEDEIFVKVGEKQHPMEKEHYIQWIAQVSENKTTRIKLYPEQNAEVRFKYIPGSSIYAYCNKHGLWKNTVK